MRAGMWFFSAFISIFYIVGFGMLTYGLLSMKRSTEASKWPTAKGSIDSCELTSSSDGEGGTTYQVKVKYSYQVAGKIYAADKLAFGYSSSSGYDAHQEILSRLKNAKTVDVRYDPNNPETAVLSYGIHRSIQFVMAFSITWLLFVFGFTIIWWVASRNDTILLQNLVTQ